MELSTDTSQKIKTNIWLSCTTPGPIFKDCLLLQRFPSIYVYSCIIHKSKEMEQAYLSIKRWMVDENVVHMHSVILFICKKKKFARA